MTERTSSNITNSVASLSQEEKALLKEYKRLYSYVSKEDRRELPSSILNLWLGNSAVALVRHSKFSAALERARQSQKDAETKRQAEILEYERKRAEEQLRRKAKRFYEFWHYRGIVYAGEKYWDSNNHRRWMVIKFFLQRKEKADQEVIITKYDLPIANGQEVAVVYSRLKGEKLGYPVVYCNFNIRKNISLNDAIRDMEGKRGPSHEGVSYEEELNEYMKRSGLQ
jgi:hypothetical protein